MRNNRRGWILHPFPPRPREHDPEHVRRSPPLRPDRERDQRHFLRRAPLFPSRQKQAHLLVPQAPHLVQRWSWCVPRIFLRNYRSYSCLKVVHHSMARSSILTLRRCHHSPLHVRLMEVGPLRLVPGGDGKLIEVEGAWNEYTNILFRQSPHSFARLLRPDWTTLQSISRLERVTPTSIPTAIFTNFQRCGNPLTDVKRADRTHADGYACRRVSQELVQGVPRILESRCN